MDKKFVDVTDRVTQAPDLDGELKAFDYMMRQNRGSIVEGGDSHGEKGKQKTIKTIKVSKTRD